MPTSQPNQIYLFEICKNLLDNYDESLSPSHFLQDLEGQYDLIESEKKYISEVFFGCCDKKNVLNVVVDGFYLKDGKTSLKSEKNIFKILTYLAIYKCNEKNINELRKLITHPEIEKILQFLKYFFNEKNLLTWIKDAWSTKFEQDYVDNDLLKPILSLSNEIKKLIEDIEFRIYKTKEIVYKKPTEIQEFNLNPPLPRRILLPEKIPEFERPKKISRSTGQLLKTSTNQTQITQPRKNTTKTTNEIKTQKLNKDLKQAENNKTIESELHAFKARPFKITQNEDAPLKLNAAVVLREEHNIKKKAQEMVKKFEYLENGDRNPVEFLKWQNEMKMNDLRKELENNEKLKLESKISYENAIKAREDLVSNKKEQAKEIKLKNTDLLNKYSEEMKETETKRKQNAIQIKETEKKFKLAEEELKITKRTIAQEVSKESNQLQSQALKEVEEEMRRKMELIQQIKAAESIPIERTKMVDLTSKAGYGLLSEMSIAELKERLEIAKRNADNERNKKHDEIVKTKLQKDEELVEKLYYINRFRNENSALEKKFKNLSFDQLQKSMVKDLETNSVTLVNLKNNLNQIKNRREKSKNSLTSTDRKSDINFQANVYSNQRKMMEWERFQDLEQTKERLASFI